MSHSSLQLDIDSNQPWFPAIEAVTDDAIVTATVTVNGVPQEYQLDSLWEITTMQPGVRAYRTVWDHIES